MKVYNPTLTVAPAEPVALAPRRPWDRPLRLGLVDNGKPRTRELLLMVADQLRELVPVAAVELVSKPSAAYPLGDDEAAALAAKVDVAVAGLGDCGACSACSLQDALLLERNGVPATVLITDVFVANVARFADVLGAPGYHTLVVPHPVASKSDEVLRALARSSAAAAVGQVASPALVDA